MSCTFGCWKVRALQKLLMLRMLHYSGPFQGPALTIAYEGVVLTTEEVCILQTNPQAKLRGQLCQYGTGLLGAYHVTELPFVVSGGCLYLFDPSGQVLASSLTDGRASPSNGNPVGKAYALKGAFHSLLPSVAFLCVIFICSFLLLSLIVGLYIRHIRVFLELNGTFCWELFPYWLFCIQ